MIVRCRLLFTALLLASAPLACQCGEGFDPDQDAGLIADGGARPDGDAGVIADRDAGADGGPADGGCPRKGNGEACTADRECCSSACDPGTARCVSGAGACVGLGERCQSNVECCGGKTCEPDATGQRRCTDRSYCQGAGEACTQASQCCSLSCGDCTALADGGQDCACLTSGALCAKAGSACAENAECCSNECENDACLSAGVACVTLGESCTTEGYDPGCCSRHCVQFGSNAAPDLRCAPSSTCGARGEICANGADCCSGVCLNGLCPSQHALGQKLFVGEPCADDAECASYACASAFPGGPQTCQFLGGCRPAEERCTEDWQCCGFLELSNNVNACRTATPTVGACGATSIEGLKRCVLQPTDKEVGEICESGGNKVHSCCGGEAVCQPTLTGVSRCLGGGFTPDGGCLSSGSGCAIADECCSRVCAPGISGDGGTGLTCSGCVAEGAACTTGNDCCERSCVDGLCRPPVGADGGGIVPSCLPLSAACGVDGGAGDPQCCSLLCSGGACATCRAAFDRCALGADCCSGLCVNGACDPGIN